MSDIATRGREWSGARLTETALRRRGGEKWHAAAPGILPAWVAESDFEVPPAARAALLDVVDRGEFGYVSPLRRDAYRAAVARWYRERHGVGVEPGDVHPVADVIEAYRRTIRDFTDADTPVVVPAPAYPPFFAVAEQEGRRVITVDTVDGLDLDLLEATLSERPSLLVICNPHNPLGRVAGLDELRAIASIVDRCGGRVFSDEIHAPLVLDAVRHVPYFSVCSEAASHTITAFAASKAFNLPGLKAAALLTSNLPDRSRWEGLGHLASHGASVMGLAAGAAALEHDRDWLDESIGYLRGNRHRVLEAVAEIDGARATASQATYLQWIDVADSPAMNSPQVSSPAVLCAEGGLLVSDGAAFGGFSSCIRFNFASPRPLLDAALARLIETLSHR